MNSLGNHQDLINKKIQNVNKLVQSLCNDCSSPDEEDLQVSEGPNYKLLYNQESKKNQEIKKELELKEMENRKMNIYQQRLLQMLNRLKEKIAERESFVHLLLEKQKDFEIELAKTRMTLEQERIKKDASHISNIQKKDKPDESQDAEDDNLLFHNVKVDDNSLNDPPKRFKTEDSLLLSLNDEEAGNYRPLHHLHDPQIGGISASVQHLYQEINQLRNANEMYVGQIEQLRQERDRLEQQLRQQVSHQSDYEEVLTTNLNEEMAELEFKCIEYQKDVRRLEAQLRSEQIKIAKFQRYQLEVAERKAEIQELKHRLRWFEAKKEVPTNMPLVKASQAAPAPATQSIVQDRLVEQKKKITLLEKRASQLQTTLDTERQKQSTSRQGIRAKLEKVSKLFKDLKAVSNLLSPDVSKSQKEFGALSHNAQQQIEKLFQKVIQQHASVCNQLKRSLASKDIRIKQLELQGQQVRKYNRKQQGESQLERSVAQTLQTFSEIWKVNSAMQELDSTQRAQNRIISTLIQCLEELVWYSETLPKSVLETIRDLSKTDSVVTLEIKSQLLLQRARFSEYYQKPAKTFEDTIYSSHENTKRA